MKKLLILLVCIIGSLSVSAQNESTDYLTRGYRGFAEMGLRPLISEPDFSSSAITTIHGYHSGYGFIGGGLSIQPYSFSYRGEDYSFSETDSRLELPKKISPFIDTRIGFVAGDFSGFYLAQAVGVRFLRFSLSIGYEDEWFSSFEIDGVNYDLEEKITMKSLMLNFTVEWGARKK